LWNDIGANGLNDLDQFATGANGAYRRQGRNPNMTHYHAVVWIDHREARVFHFSPDEVEKLVLHPEHPTKHIHHKANTIGSGHVPADNEFLHAVAAAVADAGAVLIAGPANAKTQLVKYIDAHDPKLMKAIAGVETVDHPSDGELVKFARHYLSATDRMKV
jgi:stalled ribosome rescue protein Dom34